MKTLRTVIISITLILSVLLLGCNEKKTVNPGKKASIDIKSFWIADDEGVTCFVFECQATGKSKMIIRTPSGESIIKEIEENTSVVSIPVSEPMRSISSGNYIVQVKSLEEKNYNAVIYSDILHIGGPKPKILGVTSLWKHIQNRYEDVLYDISVILKNGGDVPAYPYSVELIIDNISYGIFGIKGDPNNIIQSNERKVLKLNFTRIEGIPTNFFHELRLILYDRYGQILDEYTQIKRMNIH